jgi:threonine dehydratase
MDIYCEVEQAEKRIRPYIRQTWLEPSPYFSELSGANVYFKCENLQHTGSFKVRGALNKILSLDQVERERGVVAASTGNHGMAVAFALANLGARGLVFVPESAIQSKVEAIEQLGAAVRVFGSDGVEAEAKAREYAANNGLSYISPYNDPQIIGGQGTIGVELNRQLNTIDAVFVSLGGGGLASGIAGYLKRGQPELLAIGCSPENSQVMIQSVQAGEILDLPSLPTLSDGTAGGVESGSITFELCRDLVDDYVTVSEQEIAGSLYRFIREHRMLIEGSAAVAIAAFIKQAHIFAGKNVVIVLCGANIGLETLSDLLQEQGNIE